MSLTTFSQVDITNFKITSTANQTYNEYDRIDYEFDIRGNYGTNEIKLWLYYESVTTNNDNLINYIRWNREGDDNLNYPSYTTKQMWGLVAPFNQTQPRTVSTSANKKFYLVVEYQGQSTTHLYTFPDADSDGDGINDSVDRCPNQFGVNSNDGCPLPDFVFDNNFLSGDSGTIIINNYQYPKVKKKDQLHIEAVIKNDGGSYEGGPNVDISFYVSRSSTLGLTNYVHIYTKNTIYKISDTDIKQADKYYKIPEHSPSVNNNIFTSSGIHYIHYIIDKDDNIDEVDDVTNNYHKMAFYFDSSSSGSAPPEEITDPILIDDPNGGLGGETQLLSRNFTPTKNQLQSNKFPINNTKFPSTIISLVNFSKISVKNERELKKALQRIPKGFYVIHEKSGLKRKIIKQ